MDWYPWGSEALERAKHEDKPIFLSVGYSACHWCHVMEKESFTDPETAELLNSHFVSIKVDREERPDLDAIYMDAVSALTGGGGWPLSVWLTPDGAPFYGGTYFPDRPRFGMPSFGQILQGVAKAWTDSRQELEASAQRVVEHMRRADAQGHDEAPTTAQDARFAAADELSLDDTTESRPLEDSRLVTAIQEQALSLIDASFDPEQGGWGDAPKFPQPVLIDLLLTHQALQPDDALWLQIETTLDHMAAGGIYDHLGGGFHRYSTDGEWLVPHFEKMLYDNALLAATYLHAWQLSGKNRYREVCEETLDYLLRDMRHDEGAFFSSEDADSEGEEGRYYVWTDEEIGAALPPDEAAALRRTYGVTAKGNFEGRNILQLVREPESAAEKALLKRGRTTLEENRRKRVRPARDDKVLASWNGLALTAFAEAGRAFGSQKYTDAAVSCARFLGGQMITPDGGMVHSWKDGQASSNGFLEDYALAANGLLSLYQATFDETWFDGAKRLLDAIPTNFGRSAGGFFDTGVGHEQLISRPRSTADTPLPSGNSAACMGFLKLAAYTGEGSYLNMVEEALRTVEDMLKRAPTAFAHWLSVQYLGSRGLRELAIVGDLEAGTTRALTEAAFETYRPDLVTARRGPEAASVIPLLHDRQSPSTATAWLCRRSSCLAPTSEPDRLRELLTQG